MCEHQKFTYTEKNLRPVFYFVEVTETGKIRTVLLLQNSNRRVYGVPYFLTKTVSDHYG